MGVGRRGWPLVRDLRRALSSLSHEVSVEGCVGEREFPLLVEVAHSGQVEWGLAPVISGVDTRTERHKNLY